jgi:hypothetical protein
MNHEEEFEGFETPLILMVEEVLERIRRAQNEFQIPPPSTFPAPVSADQPSLDCAKHVN